MARLVQELTSTLITEGDTTIFLYGFMVCLYVHLQGPLHLEAYYTDFALAGKPGVYRWVIHKFLIRTKLFST